MTEARWERGEVRHLLVRGKKRIGRVSESVTWIMTWCHWCHSSFVAFPGMRKLGSPFIINELMASRDLVDIHVRNLSDIGLMSLAIIYACSQFGNTCCRVPQRYLLLVTWSHVLMQGWFHATLRRNLFYGLCGKLPYELRSHSSCLVAKTWRNG